MILVQVVAGRFVVDNQGTIVCFWVVTDVIANVQCVSAVLFDYNTRPLALSGPLCHCLYALKELSYVLGFISGFKEVAGIDYVDKRGMMITYFESNLRRGYHSHFATQDTILFCE